MRKLLLVLILGTFCLVGFFSYAVFHIFYSHNISVSVQDSEDSYRFYASYPRDRVVRIQHYLDNKFHNIGFRKGKVDAYVTLDDHTRIYIKSIPGRLLMKLDKNNNDKEACLHLKQLGEDIQVQLTQN